MADAGSDEDTRAGTDRPAAVNAYLRIRRIVRRRTGSDDDFASTSTQQDRSGTCKRPTPNDHQQRSSLREWQQQPAGSPASAKHGGTQLNGAARASRNALRPSARSSGSDLLQDSQQPSAAILQVKDVGAEQQWASNCSVREFAAHEASLFALCPPHRQESNGTKLAHLVFMRHPAARAVICAMLSGNNRAVEPGEVYNAFWFCADFHKHVPLGVYSIAMEVLSAISMANGLRRLVCIPFLCDVISHMHPFANLQVGFFPILHLTCKLCSVPALQPILYVRQSVPP